MKSNDNRQSDFGIVQKNNINVNVSWYVKLFRYLEPMWTGNDGTMSIRRFLALIFSMNLLFNVYHIVHHWEMGKSYSDAAMLLGIEAGLIAALLSLTTYSSTHSLSQTNKTYIE
jgi:hypothetical protein